MPAVQGLKIAVVSKQPRQYEHRMSRNLDHLIEKPNQRHITILLFGQDVSPYATGCGGHVVDLHPAVYSAA